MYQQANKNSPRPYPKVVLGTAGISICSSLLHSELRSAANSPGHAEKVKKKAGEALAYKERQRNPTRLLRAREWRMRGR